MGTGRQILPKGFLCGPGEYPGKKSAGRQKEKRQGRKGGHLHSSSKSLKILPGKPGFWDPTPVWRPMYLGRVIRCSGCARWTVNMGRTLRQDNAQRPPPTVGTLPPRKASGKESTEASCVLCIGTPYSGLRHTRASMGSWHARSVHDGCCNFKIHLSVGAGQGADEHKKCIKVACNY